MARAVSTGMRSKKIALCVLTGTAGWMLLAAAAGCQQPKPEPVQPAPVYPLGRVLSEINRRFDRLSGAIYCNPVDIVAVFPDEKGRTKRVDLAGKMVFRPPRYFYLELNQTLAGTVGRVASNEEIFWAWLRLDREKRLWWGRWDDLSNRSAVADGMPLRADHLLAAMGLAGIPQSQLQGIIGPVRLLEEQADRLLFIAAGDGAGWVRQEYWVTRREPFLIKRVIFRNRLGEIVMTSDLEGHRLVRGSDFYIARKVNIEWPGEAATLRMTLHRPRLRAIGPDSRLFRLDPARCPVPQKKWTRITGPPGG